MSIWCTQNTQVLGIYIFLVCFTKHDLPHTRIIDVSMVYTEHTGSSIYIFLVCFTTHDLPHTRIIDVSMVYAEHTGSWHIYIFSVFHNT